MSTKEEQIKMSKRNMKLFPIYKGMAWDYLFYSTIDFFILYSNYGNNLYNYFYNNFKIYENKSRFKTRGIF